MKTIVIEDRTAEYVFVNLVFRTGSLHDTVGREGTAYLSGNTLLLGTKRLDRPAFFEELDHLGAELDVSVSKESVVIEGEVITRNLEALFALIGEIVLTPAFDPDEVARLRRRTAAELEHLRDNDEALCSVLHSRAMWSGHRYGRPGKGSISTLGTIEPDELAAHHAAHLTAPNLLVGAAGDIDEERLRELMARYLTGLSQAPAPQLDLTPPPHMAGTRVLLIDKPERTQTQIIWGHPCIHAAHVDYFPLLVANTAFGGTFTARLMHEIREKRGWSYGAYSRLSVDRRVGAFSMRYFPAAKDTLAALEVGHTLLRDVAREGITADELAFAQSYLANGFAFRVETAAKRLGQLLEIELLGRPHDYLERYVEAVRAVTLEEANRALATHLHPDDLHLTLVCTAEPFAEPLRQWKSVTDLRVHPYDQEWPASGPSSGVA